MQGGPSSVHKLPLVSIRNVLHITNNLKTLYEKFNIVVKPQKYRHNIEINCTYVNLGLLLPFLSNLGSIHGHFIRFCYSLSVRCCFPTQNEARQLTLFSLNSQISPASKNRAPIHHESAKSLRSGQSLISSPFYIRSSNWIIPNTAEAQSVDYLRVGRSTFFHAILITRFPWVHVRVHHTTFSHRGSWAHVRLLRTKNYKKNFPQKHIEIWRGEAKGLALRICRFYGESVRGSLIRERFVSWDCTESLGMLRWKTTPYKQRAAQPYKMATNWAQVTQKKQRQTHVYVSTIYFYIWYVHISTV